MARNYRDGPKWMVGVVVECKGPLSYVVQVNHGMLWRRHLDQLRNGPRTAPDRWQIDRDVEISTSPEPEEREEGQTQETENDEPESPENVASQTENSTEPAQEAAESNARRYRSRIRQPPQRYQ